MTQRGGGLRLFSLFSLFAATGLRHGRAPAGSMTFPTPSAPAPTALPSWPRANTASLPAVTGTARRAGLIAVFGAASVLEQWLRLRNDGEAPEHTT